MRGSHKFGYRSFPIISKGRTSNGGRAWLLDPIAAPVT